ncbi:hypothetical protein [Chachezhania antarctica]|uniref:hypothetical protein n=1 Tax=Chachezhania antarctica TaxID=2340860 RepID=UPI000EAF54AA|nr:hypothetical protein [Chachezhania antarctica]|tara:strand:- start:11728 stop:12525 length:798 start_codon:yes stop_codon:yes gene_type:complete
MLIKKIATGTAIAALLSTTALAGTAVKKDAEIEADASTSTQMESTDTVGENLNEAGESLENAAESTLDAAGNAASSAGTALENTAEDAAQAIDNTADDAARAADNTAEDVERAAENTADDMEDAADEPAVTTAAPVDPAVADDTRFTSVDQMTVGDVVGMIAYSPEEERIGEIDYVVVENGEPAAVIGIGGFLGLAEYTVALPMNEFELSEDGTFFTVGATAEALKERPEFDETGVEGLPHDTSMADVTSMDAAPSDATAPLSGS